MPGVLDRSNLREHGRRNCIAFACDHLITFQRNFDRFDAAGFRFSGTRSGGLVQYYIRTDQRQEGGRESRLLLRRPTWKIHDPQLEISSREGECRHSGARRRDDHLCSGIADVNQNDFLLQAICIGVVVDVARADFANQGFDALEFRFLEVARYCLGNCRPTFTAPA